MNDFLYAKWKAAPLVLAGMGGILAYGYFADEGRSVLLLIVGLILMIGGVLGFVHALKHINEE